MQSTTRANLQDVARAAGVSLATVDRVLHGRAGVHVRTVERVKEAVRRLGYRPDPAAARLARNRSVRLAFVLPSGTNSFITLLNQQVQGIAHWLAEQRASAVVQTVDVFAPLVLAQHLRDLQGRFDAVVVMALDHAQVRAAIDDLVAGLLKRDPAVAGLYSIGAGNRGIQAALLASGRAQHVAWVCHELTPHARRALLDGVADAVINQDAGHEVRSACRLALARLSGERVLRDQERIRIDIFLKDNLP
jgi:DNA-binding LacI/PurR family transcriptional regulator